MFSEATHHSLSLSSLAGSVRSRMFIANDVRLSTQLL